MSITLKRQLNDEEKAQIIGQHGRVCYANGHEIPEGEQIQFDHIRAYSKGGLSELNNIAPMCATHNKEKGQLPLYDFRIKLRLKDFFSKGDKLTLKHLLEYLKTNGNIKDFAEPVTVKADGNQVVLESPSNKYTFNTYDCPTTHWKYFYATLDVALLDSDDEDDQSLGLQPRFLIFDKVFELFRHFQVHPVLQPSIGRVVGSRIRLFDGQHKAAALLWNGRTSFECKIYIEPELRLLNQTNIAAHEKYAQTRFFSSVMVLKLGTQFGQDFEGYKSLEDGQQKSEAGFMEYLRQKDPTLTNAQLNQRFRSFLYNSVLKSTDNKLDRLVATANRSTETHPLTLDMLEKSLFSCFLHREPVADNLSTDAYKRESEITNLVDLMNILDDLALSHWDSKANPTDETQRKLSRMTRSKSIMAWSELLRDAVCAKIDLHDGDEKAKPFYRDLSNDQMKLVRGVVERLVNWKRWNDPTTGDDNIDRVLADNKSEVKTWFRQKGLTTGYLMGAPE
jgi:hypothetical protein